MASRITARAVDVGTSATVLVPTGATRRSLRVFNNGPNAIYLGPDNAVTTATGYPVPAGAERQLDGELLSKALWAIAVTAAQTSPANTRVWEAFVS